MNCNNHLAETIETGDKTTKRPVSERVVRAVADREGRDAIDLDPPLYTAINPDALDALFDASDVDGRVTFEWRGHRIEVSASGSITLSEVQTC